MQKWAMERTKNKWLQLLFLNCFTLMLSAQEFQDSMYVATDSVKVEQEQTYTFGRSSDSVVYTSRHIPIEKIKAIKAEKKFWYADKAFHKDLEADLNYVPFMERGWVKFLFWMLVIGGFAAALIWYLSDSNIRVFKKQKRLKEQVNENDEMPEDIFAINYERQIKKAESAGDFRMAVRLQFLGLLKNMADSNIISYRSDRTNLDYLFQVNNKDFYNDFFRLVRYYEYSWYGHFNVEGPVYNRVAMDFNNIKEKLV